MENSSPLYYAYTEERIITFNLEGLNFHLINENCRALLSDDWSDPLAKLNYPWDGRFLEINVIDDNNAIASNRVGHVYDSFAVLYIGAIIDISTNEILWVRSH